MKQFSKKEIEKRFKAVYPDGELFKDSNTWCWCKDQESKVTHLYRVFNNYDLAESLYLASKEEIAEMKKNNHYVAYQ